MVGVDNAVTRAAETMPYSTRAGSLGALVAVVLAACGPTGPGGGVGDGRGDGGACTQMCSERCVDIRSDPAHCGACNQPCSSDESCHDGLCVDSSCSETSSTGQSLVLPADIILVVDNSGSMTDEAGFVQARMTDFVGAITASGIDARVVLISADSTDDQGICLPAPVGSGSCPADQNLPLYRHVVQTVSSSNSLELILGTYAQWQESLRPAATKTIAVISDDDSALDAASFLDQLVALDPTFSDVTFDAIVAPYDLSGAVCFPCLTSGNCAACDPCCGPDSFTGTSCVALPADEGAVYAQLVSDTGGVLGNLCTQDFAPVFEDMATAVVTGARVPCLYALPPAPPGESLDFGRVNVEYRPDGGASWQLIPQVPGGEAECGAAGGWYYDVPASPSSIVLCPATCEQVQNGSDPEVRIKVGCATVIL